MYKGLRHDPKNFRVFVIVSRRALIESKFSTVMCAPVYSSHLGISTQVEVGPEEGLKHNSCIYCDEIISIPKSSLSDYVGSLPDNKIEELNRALAIALELE